MTLEQLDKILSNRTMSSFGVSIGTGLLLESIFDPTDERYDKERVVPNKVDLNNFDIWLFNGFTLLRNIITACTEPIDISVLYNKKHIDRIMEEVEAEITIIHSLLLSVNKPETFFVLFIPEYKELISKFNVGKDVDVKYIHNNRLLFEIFKVPLLATSNEIVKLHPTGYKVPLNYKDGKVLLTSHYTLDLLQSNKWKLLESHTGILKDQHLFNTKYHKYGTNDLSHLPMNDILLYLLGDDELVQGMNRKVKSTVYNISISSKWTFRTTRDKIRSDLLKDPLLVPIIKEFKGY